MFADVGHVNSFVELLGTFLPIPKVFNLFRSNLCETASNAFWKSTYTAVVSFERFRFLYRSDVYSKTVSIDKGLCRSCSRFFPGSGSRDFGLKSLGLVTFVIFGMGTTVAIFLFWLLYYTIW